MLLLPSRPAVWLATGAGLVLGVLTLLKLLDLGVSVAFARRFDPLGDPVYVGAGVSFLRDAMGTANAWTATVLAVALMVAVLVLVPYAVLRATRLARGHRPVAVPVVLALSLVWVGCAVAGVRVAPGEPVAAATAVDLASTHVTEVRDRLRERAALAAQIADDDFADVPPSRLLTGAARQGRAARVRRELRPGGAGGPADVEPAPRQRGRGQPTAGGGRLPARAARTSPPRRSAR